MCGFHTNDHVMPGGFGHLHKVGTTDHADKCDLDYGSEKFATQTVPQTYLYSAWCDVFVFNIYFISCNNYS